MEVACLHFVMGVASSGSEGQHRLPLTVQHQDMPKGFRVKHTDILHHITMLNVGNDRL